MRPSFVCIEGSKMFSRRTRGELTTFFFPWSLWCSFRPQLIYIVIRLVPSVPLAQETCSILCNYPNCIPSNCATALRSPNNFYWKYIWIQRPKIHQKQTFFLMGQNIYWPVLCCLGVLCYFWSKKHASRALEACMDFNESMIVPYWIHFSCHQFLISGSDSRSCLLQVYPGKGELQRERETSAGSNSGTLRREDPAIWGQRNRWGGKTQTHTLYISVQVEPLQTIVPRCLFQGQV
jgi:hypothetical protein